MTKQYFTHTYIYNTTSSVSIHFVDRHLGCFHILAIVNNAAMDTGQILSNNCFVFKYPGVEFLGHMILLGFFEKPPHCFPSGYTSLRSRQQCTRVSFSPHPCQHLLFVVFLIIDSLIAQLVKNPSAMQETWFNSWVGKIHWIRDRLPNPVFLGFPCG